KHHTKVEPGHLLTATSLHKTTLHRDPLLQLLERKHTAHQSSVSHTLQTRQHERHQTERAQHTREEAKVVVKRTERNLPAKNCFKRDFSGGGCHGHGTPTGSNLLTQSKPGANLLTGGPKVPLDLPLGRSNKAPVPVIGQPLMQASGTGLNVPLIPQAPRLL